MLLILIPFLNEMWNCLKHHLQHIFIHINIDLLIYSSTRGHQVVDDVLFSNECFMFFVQLPVNSPVEGTIVYPILYGHGFGCTIQTGGWPWDF